MKDTHTNRMVIEENSIKNCDDLFVTGDYCDRGGGRIWSEGAWRWKSTSEPTMPSYNIQILSSFLHIFKDRCSKSRNLHGWYCKQLRVDLQCVTDQLWNKTCGAGWQSHLPCLHTCIEHDIVKDCSYGLHCLAVIRSLLYHEKEQQQDSVCSFLNKLICWLINEGCSEDLWELPQIGI